MRALLVILCVSCLFSSAGWAGTPAPFPKGLHSCGTERVEEALSGDRIKLAGGQTAALAEVKAPEYWPEGSAYRSWPHAGQSKAALQALVAGKDVSLFCAHKQRQRNHAGDLVAHVRLNENQLWVQQQLVEQGAAYFFPHFGKTVAAQALLKAEDEARRNREGIWKNEEANPVSATGSNLKPGWFQLVRGRVVKETRRKDKTYLNFGDDWRTDFTVEIPRNLYRVIAGAGSTELGFTDKWVEARGWVEWAGGPKIILWDHTQIRILEEPEG